MGVKLRLRKRRIKAGDKEAFDRPLVGSTSARSIPSTESPHTQQEMAQAEQSDLAEKLLTDCGLDLAPLRRRIQELLDSVLSRHGVSSEQLSRIRGALPLMLRSASDRGTGRRKK